VGENISLKFRLDQRLFDIPNSSLMLPVMEKLASFLSCKLNTYTINPKSKPKEVLSLSVTGINKLEFIVNYFNKYPLLGVKGTNLKNWEVVYHMILSKEHLTDAGRLKIRSIAFEMKRFTKYKNSSFQHITTVCKTKVPSLNLTICWKLLKPKVRREMSSS